MTARRVLLVEDDTDIARALVRGLTAENYVVDHAATMREARALIAEADHPMVIVDRILPDGDGVDLCLALRARGSLAMILLLTARDAIADRVEGLRAGADDYLTKPFAFEELLARIDAMARRAPEPQDEAALMVGTLEVDPAIRGARLSGREIALTAREYALLRCLAARQGRAVAKTEILREVWGYGFDPGTNIVEVYVRYLRQKLQADGDAPLIETVRGHGYRLACGEG